MNTILNLGGAGEVICMSLTSGKPTHPAFQAIRAAFPKLKLSGTEYRGCSTLVVEPEHIHDVMSFLKNDDAMQFNFLTDITAADYPEYPAAHPSRFAMVYVVEATSRDERFIVKTYLEPSIPTDGIEEDPALFVDSVVDLWAGAEWMEREVFDMFGVRFNNHPDLRRILLWEDFPAHPLRKDYPLRGRGERETYPVVDRSSA